MTMSEIDWITDTVAVSGIDAAYHTSEDFDAIVTVCQDSIKDNCADSCLYTQVPLQDGPTDVYANGVWHYKYYKQAVESVIDHITHDHSLLVHCHHGKSRSPTVLATALAVIHDEQLGYSFARIKNERPIVSPKTALWEYARQYTRRADSGRIDYTR